MNGIPWSYQVSAGAGVIGAGLVYGWSKLPKIKNISNVFSSNVPEVPETVESTESINQRFHQEQTPLADRTNQIITTNDARSLEELLPELKSLLPKYVAILTGLYASGLPIESHRILRLMRQSEQSMPGQRGPCLWASFSASFEENYRVQHPTPEGFFAYAAYYVKKQWDFFKCWCTFRLLYPFYTTIISQFCDNVFTSIGNRIDGRNTNSDEIDQFLTTLLKGFDDHFMRTAESIRVFEENGHPTGNIRTLIEERIRILRNLPKEEIIRRFSDQVSRFLPSFAVFSHLRTSSSWWENFLGYLALPFEWIIGTILRSATKRYLMPKIIRVGLESGIQEVGSNPLNHSLLSALYEQVKKFRIRYEREHWARPANLDHPPVLAQRVAPSDEVAISDSNKRAIRRIANNLATTASKWPRTASRYELTSNAPSWARYVTPALKPFLLRDFKEVVTEEIHQRFSGTVEEILTSLFSVFSDRDNLRDMLKTIGKTSLDYLQKDPALSTHQPIQLLWKEELEQLMHLIVKKNTYEYTAKGDSENLNTDEARFVQALRRKAENEMQECFDKYTELERRFLSAMQAPENIFVLDVPERNTIQNLEKRVQKAEKLIHCIEEFHTKFIHLLKLSNPNANFLVKEFLLKEKIQPLVQMKKSLIKAHRYWRQKIFIAEREKEFHLMLQSITNAQTMAKNWWKDFSNYIHYLKQLNTYYPTHDLASVERERENLSTQGYRFVQLKLAYEEIGDGKPLQEVLQKYAFANEPSWAGIQTERAALAKLKNEATEAIRLARQSEHNLIQELKAKTDEKPAYRSLKNYQKSLRRMQAPPRNLGNQTPSTRYTVEGQMQKFHNMSLESFTDNLAKDLKSYLHAINRDWGTGYIGLRGVVDGRIDQGVNSIENYTKKLIQKYIAGEIVKSISGEIKELLELSQEPVLANSLALHLLSAGFSEE